MKGFAWGRVCGLVLLAALAGQVHAQVPAKILDNGKAATGLVLRSGNTGSGTCFCIDQRGYYITNEHVVAGTEEDGLTIVMNPATEKEYTLNAKVVDVDRDADLALIKADLGDKKPGVLGLADGAKPPRETEQLIAFGFPFGDLLAFNDGFPAVSVNLGRVTSLRTRNGELRAIQTDTTLNFGNSGGPMLDKDGKVAGVVISGLPGTGINFAIPVHKVHTFLKTPRIDFTEPAAIAYAERFEPVELTLGLTAFDSGDKPYDVTIEVESDGQTRAYPAKAGEGGRYTAKLPPAIRPADDGNADQRLDIEIAYEKGRVGCKIEDIGLRLDGKALKLSEVTLLDRRKAGEVRVVMADGSERIGKALEADAVAVDLGGVTVKIDPVQAQWLVVKRPEPADASGFTAPLTVRVKRGNDVLAEGQYALRVLDPAVATRPELPGGLGKRPELPGNALVFDAAKDKKLAGWSTSGGLPPITNGALTFEGERNVTLTYDGDIDILQMTIEFDTVEFGQGFWINYGNNWQKVGVGRDTISLGMSKPSERDGRPHGLGGVNAPRDGRSRVTLAFDKRGQRTIRSGEETFTVRREAAGELSIRIEGQQPFKIHRIEIVPRGGVVDPSMIEKASVVTLPKDAAEAEQDDAVINLAGAYQSFDVGAGGRYMLFHVPEKQSIEIVDVVKGKIVHRMEDVSDDVIIAAGLEHFVLVRPGQKILQKWAYDGFERVKVARLPGSGQTRLALLGANSTGPLLLGADDTVFVDLETLRQIETTGVSMGKLGKDTFASADNRTYGAVAGGGYTRFQFDDGYIWSDRIGEQGYARRWAKPSADGRLVLCLNQRFFDHAINEIAVDWLKGTTSYPTVDPRYFIAVKIAEPKPDQFTMHLNLCTTADRRIIDTLVGLPEMAPTKKYNHHNQIGGWLRDGWPQFHYVPWAKALITIPWDKKSVRIRKYDPIQRLKAKGIDYLFVQSAPPVYAPRGGKVSYQIDTVSSAEDIEYELLDGPKGLTVSETGLVSWTVPVKHERKKETVIVGIKNGAGEEVLHSFDLTYD